MLLRGQYLISEWPSHLWQQGYKHLVRMIGMSWYIWCNTPQAHVIFHWISVPTELASWNGGWMHHLQFILICEDIQEEVYLWGMDSQPLTPKKRSSMKKVPRRQKSWTLKTSCQLSSGKNYFIAEQFYSVKDNCLHQGKTRVSLFWRIMGRPL